MIDTPVDPFFVVGAQRSGTTMLRLMLNSHPRLAVPFEWRVLKPVEELPQFGDLSHPDSADRLLAHIEADPFSQKGELVTDRESVLSRPIGSYSDMVRAIGEVYASARGKPRFGIKTPGLVTQLDTVRQLFPSAKIVHIVRDGRDVAVSNRGVSWGIKHLPKAAADWRWKVLLGQKMGSMIPEDYLNVRYEDLVLAPEETLRTICAFLGESFDPRMLQYEESAIGEMPASSLEWHQSSVTAPDPSKVYGWRHRLSNTDAAIFEEIAGDALAFFGYEPSEPVPKTRKALRRAFYNLVQRW